AAAQKFHQRHDVGVELGGGGVGNGLHRFHRRLYALDVAAVVGPPYVDQGRETTVHLGLVVGDVGGKIGIAAVRLHQRSIDIVTEVGRAKQRLLSVLPI